MASAGCSRTPGSSWATVRVRKSRFASRCASTPASQGSPARQAARAGYALALCSQSFSASLMLLFPAWIVSGAMFPAAIAFALGLPACAGSGVKATQEVPRSQALERPLRILACRSRDCVGQARGLDGFDARGRGPLASDDSDHDEGPHGVPADAQPASPAAGR